MIKQKTEKEIRAFCRGQYYTDDGITLCLVWEDYTEKDIEEFIEDDVWALKAFLNVE